jgi:hypothetical protein
MWEAVIGLIGTVLVGVFGVFWKNRSNKTKEETLGEQKVINLHHQRNAEGKKAADARLREELPEGKDLIDELQDDARRADRD